MKDWVILKSFSVNELSGAMFYDMLQVCLSLWAKAR